jgi:hypothetical protein
MSYRRVHIVLKVLALAALVFYSTGATVVVRYCTMSESAECCCKAERNASNAAPSMLSLQVAGCLSVQVVGGLDETRGTITPNELAKDAGRTVIAIAAPVNLELSVSSLLSHLPSVQPSPPQLDICLSGCTLLI